MATLRELVDADGAPRADATANSETQHTMAVGDDFLGDLADPDDHDWIRVELQPGTSYVIRLHGHGEDPVNDPLLELYDADGERVAFNDDLYQGVLHSQIVFTTPGIDEGADAPLVYYINARSYSLNPALASDGDYRLSLSEQQPLSAPEMPPAAPDALLNPETVITGFSVRDKLTGDEADNVLEGRGDADTLDGGGQPADGLGDTASYRRADSGVNVNLRTGRGEDGEAEGDTLVDIENLIGSSHDDVLTGDINDNILLGGPGDDTLAGDGGADLLVGGPGTDTASYYRNFSNHGVRVDLALGVADGSTAEGDRLSGIENIIGTTQDDKLYGDDGANRLWGYRGNDLLSGRGGADVFVFYHDDGHDTVLDFEPEQDTLELHLFYKHGSYWQELDIRSAGQDSVIRIDQDNSLTLKGVAPGELGEKHFVLVMEIPPPRSKSEQTDGGARVADEDDNSGSGQTPPGAPPGGNPPSDKTVNGTPGDDTLNGGSGNETMNGGKGDDTLNGGAGSDTLNGGPGADTLDGGTGIDTARYESPTSGASSSGAGAASNSGVTIDLSGTPVNGYIIGEGGDAEGDKLKNIENLWGSPHNDTLTGDDKDNVLWGRAGDDTLKGKGGNDGLIGGVGEDTMDGGSGTEDYASYSDSGAAVTIDLGGTKDNNGYVTGKGGEAEGDLLKNIEYLVGSANGDTLTGDSNANTLWGVAGDDTLDGGGGDDTLLGGAGDDTLKGGAGSNDSLDGGTGADTLDGGAGDFDAARYDNSPSGVTIDLSGTKDGDGYITGKGGDAEGDKLKNIEYLYGSPYNDTLTGVGGSLWSSTYLEGGAGADTLEGGRLYYVNSPAGVTIDLSGTKDGNGYITGKGGDAEGDKIKNIISIRGSAHDDNLTGDNNDDYMSGGDSNETGNDTLKGKGGKDRLWGFGGDDTVSGGDGDDKLYGGKGDDTLTGGAGDDELGHVLQIGGEAGKDTLTGGAGNDTLYGGTGADTLDGGTGTDTAWYDGSNGVTIDLGGTKDSNGYVTGKGGEAEGDKLKNIENLQGSPGDDTLTGDGNSNTLEGKAGNDTLTGGGGNDIFVFIDPWSGSISDTITDFSTSGDKIDLSAFSLTGFSDTRLTVTTGNTDTVITVDSDVTITLQNMTSTLDSGDFIFS